MHRGRVKKTVCINTGQQPEQRQKPHICTIKQLAQETGMSEYTIRCWAKQGKFNTLKSGTKYLINYDVFIKFLNGEGEKSTDRAAQTFGIRKVWSR